MGSEARIAGGDAVQIAVPNPEANHATTPIDNLHMAEGIEKEVLQMFGIDVATTDMSTLTKMRDISTYAMDGEMFVGDGMMKLREMIERVPPHIKDKHETIWNLISMQRKIDMKRKEVIDMEKRKASLMSMGQDHRRPY